MEFDAMPTLITKVDEPHTVTETTIREAGDTTNDRGTNLEAKAMASGDVEREQEEKGKNVSGDSATQETNREVEEDSNNRAFAETNSDEMKEQSEIVIPETDIPEGKNTKSQQKEEKSNGDLDEIESHDNFTNKFEWTSKQLWSKSHFFECLWPTLESMGWTIKQGRRAPDQYFFPPGISQQKGCRVRRDYFDSIRQVVDFLKTDQEWSSSEQARTCFRAFLKKSTPSKKASPRKRKKIEASETTSRRNSRRRRDTNTVMNFGEVIWPQLHSLGWRVDIETDTNKQFFLPPGISRTDPGFHLNIDYFDTKAQVVSFLQNNSTWNSLADVRACVEKANHISDDQMETSRASMVKSSIGSPEISSSSRKRKTTVNKEKIFFDIVWPTLESLNWTMDVGEMSCDRFYIPAGVSRGDNKYELHRDFFDDQIQVLRFLEDTPAWNSKAEVKLCLDAYDKAMTSKQKTPTKTSTPAKRRKRNPSLGKFEVVWRTLEKLGWRIESSNRGDNYYFPPGIFRGKSKNRVDYFDSRKQVLDCLVNNPKWNTREEISKCLAEFNEAI